MIIIVCPLQINPASQGIITTGTGYLYIKYLLSYLPLIVFAFEAATH